MVGDGETVRSVASAFDVSVASVVKWAQRTRTTGSAAAKAMGGKRPFLLEQERDWLINHQDERPALFRGMLPFGAGPRRVQCRLGDNQDHLTGAVDTVFESF